jgi:hypothetical protein
MPLVYDTPCARNYQVLNDFKNHIIANLPNRLLDRIMDTGLPFPDDVAENRFRTSFQTLFAQQAEALFMEYPRPGPTSSTDPFVATEQLEPLFAALPQLIDTNELNHNFGAYYHERNAFLAPISESEPLQHFNFPLTPQSNSFRNIDNQVPRDAASQFSQPTEN